jgi:signal transduction histidine kinase
MADFPLIESDALTADQLARWTTQVPFVVIFAIVAARAVRTPNRANIDTALLFGVVSALVAATGVIEFYKLRPPHVVDAFVYALMLTIPYLLLRLVDDFLGVPARVMRAAEAGLVPLSLGMFLMPDWIGLLTLAGAFYFLGFNAYSAVRFVRKAWISRGITRRRMQALATGSALIGLALVIVGFNVLSEPFRAIGNPILYLLTTGIALSYFAGFAPPTLLKRAWQEADLRELLTRAARLPRLPDTASIVRELEDGAAASLGAKATIALWDDAAGVLRMRVDGEDMARRPDEMIAGAAFSENRPILIDDVDRVNPEHRERYRRYGVQAILAAPIAAGKRRIGVLIAWTARSPCFAEDDLALVRLLADQSALILESRALIDEATRFRAREEATRLKDDFLSAAAHDLKTPLTTVIAQAQLLERRARADPDAPPDVAGIERLVSETRRLNALVLELLDASRAQEGRLVGPRDREDLSRIVRDACARQRSSRHVCRVEADAPVLGDFDRQRVEQLVEHLLENAVKFSPGGGDIRIRVWHEGDEARLSVTDRGIGIPPEELPRVFERFHRGSNVDDRRFAGMGLGLFICRGIVEEHGGRIWATSGVGRGTTVSVALPAVREAVAV